MKILLNKENRIVAYAMVGDFKNSIDVKEFKFKHPCDEYVFEDGGIKYSPKPIDIEKARQAKRNELKKIRSKKQNEDFTFMDKVFQASEKDMRNIETKFMSFQMALMLAKSQVDKDLILNQTEDWTLKDNTKFTMTARDILALYMAWDKRSKQIHHHCNTTLYNLLDEAKTVAEIEAIKWGDISGIWE